MELRTFITQALLDITHGISDAQKNSGKTKIVPATSTSVKIIEAGITPFQLVKFEIQVKIDESKGSEGKIGVVSGLIGASMAGKSSNESQHVTTLQFSVPVLFATNEESKSS